MIPGSAPPPEPRPEHREQLEVAVAHAFLPGHEPGTRGTPATAGPYPAIAPITAAVELGVHREEVQAEPEPQAGEGDVVGQELVIEIDEGERDEGPGQDHRPRPRYSPGPPSAIPRGPPRRPRSGSSTAG